MKCKESVFHLATAIVTAVYSKDMAKDRLVLTYGNDTL